MKVLVKAQTSKFTIHPHFSVPASPIASMNLVLYIVCIRQDTMIQINIMYTRTADFTLTPYPLPSPTHAPILALHLS